MPATGRYSSKAKKQSGCRLKGASEVSAGITTSQNRWPEGPEGNEEPSAVHAESTQAEQNVPAIFGLFWPRLL